MGNFFSDLFGGSNNSNNNITPSSISAMNPYQTSAANYLQGVMNNGLPSYGGQFVAPMDTYQTQGLSSLQNYLSAPTNPDLGGIQSFLMNTINGSYNPQTNPQYQAYAAQAQRNNALATRDANAAWGQRGQFFSTSALNKIGDINAQTAIGLNQTNADLQNQNQNRAMSAVGPATSLGQYIQNMPLQKTAAALNYGALPQQLDQQNLEMQYQQFLNSQGAQSKAASGLLGTPQNQLYYPKQTQSLFSQLSPMLGNLMTSNAGQGAMSSIGGGLQSLLSMFGGGGAGGVDAGGTAAMDALQAAGFFA